MILTFFNCPSDHWQSRLPLDFQGQLWFFLMGRSLIWLGEHAYGCPSVFGSTSNKSWEQRRSAIHYYKKRNHLRVFRQYSVLVACISYYLTQTVKTSQFTTGEQNTAIGNIGLCFVCTNYFNFNEIMTHFFPKVSWRVQSQLRNLQ